MSEELFSHAPRDDDSTATVTVDPTRRADHEVPPALFAKFAEHLGWNVYHGMDAQLLFNPTFGDWPFPAGCANSTDGGQLWETDPGARREQIAEFAAIQDLPESDPLAEFYESGGAFWWLGRGDVAVSPDTGPTGDRAQRVEVGGAQGTDGASADDATPVGDGLQQWLYLPLQRTGGYELELRARAASETTVTVALETTAPDGSPDERVASTDVAVSTDWTTAEATLSVPADVDVGDDDLFVASVTTAEPANMVLDRVLLYPDDHVNRADPDVVEKLRESDLPLLRWPGGNFVSGYDWTDGVGPVDQRPTKPNPAWGGLEYNLFGTAEFVEFCDAVGCEPMLCVNAGDGTPEAAAEWVEYCNGDPEKTEMGRLRAEHGHEEPFDVRHWEVGNELYGQWQVRWTTPAGNADRYQRFREAMLEADPSIQLSACGSRQARPQDRNVGDGWNDTLLAECGETVRCVTDHVLAGGPVTADTDPDELFHGFMGFADQLGEEYRDLRDRMAAAGVDDPRLAITELQLFPNYAGDLADEPSLPAAWRFSRGMPRSLAFSTKKTVSEALYHATVVHECVRMGEFPEAITHSAAVNHGGGLRKERERVWADPCHYGRTVASELGEGRPVAVDVACGTISTDRSFGQIDPVEGVPALDAVAVVDDGELVVSLVHRSSSAGPIDVALDLGATPAADEAERVELSADTMAAENTFEDPENVTPTADSLDVEGGAATFTVPPYSLTRLTVPLETP